MRTARATRWWSLSLALALLGSLVTACAPTEPTPSPGELSPLPTGTGVEPVSPEPVTVTGPIEARDAALAYLAEIEPGSAPPAGLAWSEKSITPEGLVGAEGREYTSGGWTVSVAYAVTSLEQVIYAVEVSNRATDFTWEADVDAYGAVAEFGPSGGQGQPSTGTATGGEATPLRPPPILPGKADIPGLVKGNSAFALALYHALRTQKGNLFFSPYSISAALAMTYAGARGETEEQMAQALHFDLPQADLHPSFQALAAELAMRGQGARGTGAEGFRLNIVNALWGQQGYDFLADYLALLSAYYGAGMERVDFSQPEKARGLINDWVSEQTEKRIQDLIPQGGVNELTRLILTNAIYFNASWAMQFEKARTVDGRFTRLDGTRVTVPMMSQTESFGYAAGDGCVAVELPYDGRELSMVILLPEQGRFTPIEASLGTAELEEALSGLEPTQVALTMPRFEFDSEFSLREALADLGMPLAFTSEADLTGMAAVRELFISDVFHKAFVKVDESGTEAAAATAVVVGLTAFNPVEPIPVTVDRPFLFLIRDLKTGSILFLGRVVDPSD